MAEPSVTALLQERASRVVDYIIEHLALIGVEHVFGVDGANIEDLYDAAHFCGDITAVLAKHEFSAAAMADGYSRGLAGLGVVAATSGAGSSPGWRRCRCSAPTATHTQRIDYDRSAGRLRRHFGGADLVRRLQLAVVARALGSRAAFRGLADGCSDTRR